MRWVEQVAYMTDEVHTEFCSGNLNRSNSLDIDTRIILKWTLKK
jgi:hypothetical protein